MKREDDQELWDLLGKTGTPSALSPFFARDVLRAVRQTKSWRDYALAWLRPTRLVPMSGVVLVLLVATMSIHHQPKRVTITTDDPPETVEKINPQDYDAVADLDDLLASEDDGVWSENESISL